jgi:hypothetical protein
MGVYPPNSIAPGFQYQGFNTGVSIKQRSTVVLAGVFKWYEPHACTRRCPSVSRSLLLLTRPISRSLLTHACTPEESDWPQQNHSGPLFGFLDPSTLARLNTRVPTQIHFFLFCTRIYVPHPPFPIFLLSRATESAFLRSNQLFCKAHLFVFLETLKPRHSTE